MDSICITALVCGAGGLGIWAKMKLGACLGVVYVGS
jgi:hypothetical protein